MDQGFPGVSIHIAIFKKALRTSRLASFVTRAHTLSKNIYSTAIYSDTLNLFIVLEINYYSFHINKVIPLGCVKIRDRWWADGRRLRRAVSLGNEEGGMEKMKKGRVPGWERSTGEEGHLKMENSMFKPC